MNYSVLFIRADVVWSGAERQNSSNENFRFSMLCFKVLKTGLFLYIVVCFDFYCSALVEFFWVWRLQSSNFVRGPMSSAPLAKFLILHENPRVASRQAWSCLLYTSDAADE